MPFDEIKGQPPAIEILRGMLRSKRLPHAFIFSGPGGVGKSAAALAFAGAVNCRESSDDFCGLCPSCRKIAAGMHPDVITIEPEKSVIRIDQVRAVQDDLALHAMSAVKRVVIIEQADRLHVSAANALLKTLEEPPDDTLIILVARSVAAMLPTILSRCQRIVFTPLQPQVIADILCDGGADPEKAASAARRSQGSVTAARQLLEVDFFERYSDLLDRIETGRDDRCALLDLAESVGKDTEHVEMLFSFLLSWYRDVLMARQGVPGDMLLNGDLQERIFGEAVRETRYGLLQKVKRLQWMQTHAALNVDMQLALETVFMQ